MARILPGVIALMLLSCTSTPSNQKESENESTSTAVTDGRINHGGLAINYSRCGSGNFTLLFVHGWCINQTYWAAQLDAFCADYQVVTLDLPGFGKSGKNRTNWTMEAYGKDVEAIIDQLQLTKVILIGHSMGGDVILEAAEHKAVIALIGVDNFKDVGEEFDEQTKAEIAEFMKILKQNFQEIAPAYAEQALFHTTTDTLVKSRVINDFATADPKAAISSLEALFEYGPKESERLANITQQIYLINSDATPTNRAGLEATGVAFELIDIPATGHYPMIEKPEVFNQLLKQTIRKIEVANNNK